MVLWPHLRRRHPHLKLLWGVGCRGRPGRLPRLRAWASKPTTRQPRPERSSHQAIGKGLGELNVSNGTASGAIVKHSRPVEATAVIFVHAADETTVKGIAAGAYDIRFSLGIGNNVETRRFMRHDGFQEFDEPPTLR